MTSTSVAAGNRYLLRVEGVNIAAFVSDTRNLSTNRGGSLLLLDAVQRVCDALPGACVVSRGASAGLFEITTNDPTIEAERVRNVLSADANLLHATFVVDILRPAGAGQFPEDNESVLAGNRWRQMQASSLAIPPKNTAKAMKQAVCALDGVRPANAASPAPNRKAAFISDSVNARHDYGRQEKQRFYSKIVERRSQASRSAAAARDALQQLLGRLPDFANDFEGIAVGKKPLDGKMALFYADGNGFGGHQRTHCKTIEQQIAWDEYIRSTRETFLTAFLQQEIDAKRSEWINEGAARFETLLWGGDELIFVMPASLGWRFASFFFEKLGGLNLKEAPPQGRFPNQTLTHAAALVFCQHHAPIDRIKHLAKEQMAEFAKAADRNRDSLAVVALESFDHLGASYEHAMNRRYRSILDLTDTLLCGRNGEPLSATLKHIADGLTRLRGGESFARSQLRGLVRDMVAKPGAASERAKFPQQGSGVRLPREFRNAGESERALLIELRRCFATDVALWVELEELWDYALL